MDETSNNNRKASTSSTSRSIPSPVPRCHAAAAAVYSANVPSSSPVCPPLVLISGIVFDLQTIPTRNQCSNITGKYGVNVIQNE
ncbi:hypothetical protein KIN20_023115 [Parelaphostrongylus tenuis]|uniref:Uncharacterized protein n=1 Tax=Parelaphostrongylus tenuis TaxID=148309 RepID=A0AAD5MV33_PARTN|nr:hypothetical protein KIN20_023115 [Parelaphostrongylus tenuis]